MVSLIFSKEVLSSYEFYTSFKLSGIIVSSQKVLLSDNIHGGYLHSQ